MPWSCYWSAWKVLFHFWSWDLICNHHSIIISKAAFFIFSWSLMYFAFSALVEIFFIYSLLPPPFNLIKFHLLYKKINVGSIFYSHQSLNGSFYSWSALVSFFEKAKLRLMYSLVYSQFSSLHMACSCLS